MRTFVLNRTEDETGISGTGIVAEGVEFSNGKVVVAWCTENAVHSVTVFNDIEEVHKIHGHGGKTQIVWVAHGQLATIDPMSKPGPAQPPDYPREGRHA